jgi:hypothetical protein
MYKFEPDEIRDFKIIDINGGLKKKVKLTLVGLDGNAHNLIGKFQLAAKKAGWSKEDVNFVVWKATSGNYDNLLATLMEYSSDPFGSDDDDIVYVDGQPYKKM